MSESILWDMMKTQCAGCSKPINCVVAGVGESKEMDVGSRLGKETCYF